MKTSDLRYFLLDRSIHFHSSSRERMWLLAKAFLTAQATEANSLCQNLCTQDNAGLSNLLLGFTMRKYLQ